MKIVIVGGVAGGASAAARARRLSEQAEIVLLERGPDVSFANCGLPYHIGGVIEDRSKLLVTTPKRLRDRFRLDVRVSSNVESIDRKNKSVRICDLATGRTYDETYDKLILSPGAAPVRPPIPGADLPQVHTLRNLQDTDRINEVLAEVGRAMIVGAGFIGLEMAENLVHRGVKTSIVELQNQVLPPLDYELTTPIVRTLQEHGVELFLSDSVVEITDTSQGVVARLKSGRQLQADLVLMSVGVRPENQLAEQAGLEIGARGGIRVNEFLQTSDPDIYAVGDAIEVIDFVTMLPTQMPLAGPANRQGRIAAANALGGQNSFRGVQGTAIVGVFDMTAATTGASEKTLKRANIPYHVAITHPSDHAGYYPGAEQMTLKLMYDPDTGKILGAQGVGKKGVDKRIDVLAVAIQAGMTVYDLEEAELCYAPQFGSAKDPVNMLGFVAAGRLRGDHLQTPPVEPALRGADSERFLLDVRTPAEFEKGHLQGAVNIPVDELRDRLGELPAEREIAVYCRVGQRGYIATRVLLQAGLQAVNLSGGYLSYLQYGD